MTLHLISVLFWCLHVKSTEKCGNTSRGVKVTLHDPPGQEMSKKVFEANIGEPVLVTGPCGGRLMGRLWDGATGSVWWEGEHGMCNFPGIYMLHTGELAVIFASHIDAVIPEATASAMCISKDGGVTWSPRIPRGAMLGPSGILKDGRLFFLEYNSFAAEKDEANTFVTRAHWFSDGFAREEVQTVTIHLDRKYDLNWHQFDSYPFGNPPGKLRDQLGPTFSRNVLYLEDGSLIGCCEGFFLEDRRDHPSSPHPFELYRHTSTRLTLIRSTDEGKSWHSYSTICTWKDLEPIGLGDVGPGECTMARLADGRLLSVFRTEGPLAQCWSSDEGKTWSAPEEIPFSKKGGVAIDPKLMLLSNGLLACAGSGPCYGLQGPARTRAAAGYTRHAWIQFSVDGTGREWSHHTLVMKAEPSLTGTVGCVEIEPCKLLYVCDNGGSKYIYAVTIEARKK